MKADALAELVLSHLLAYHDRVVVAGGFARDFYRYLPGFTDLGLNAPKTNDLDLAIADPLAQAGGVNLHDLLLGLGLRYQAHPGLDHRTHACGYYPGNDRRAPRPVDAHVEFLTPLRGPDRETNAQPQRDQLYAYALRYVDLLLDEPVRVEVPRYGSLLLPHPLHFIVQKTLIRGRPGREDKAARDQADAFFVMLCLRSIWPTWRSRWEGFALSQERKAWREAVLRIWRDLYARETSAGVQEVVKIYPRYQPGTVVQAMGEFLAAIGAVI